MKISDLDKDGKVQYAKCPNCGKLFMAMGASRHFKSCLKHKKHEKDKKVL